MIVRGLQNAAGFLQKKITERIESRYTPRLTFVLDQGVKNSLEMQPRSLREVLPSTSQEEPNEEEIRHFD